MKVKLGKMTDGGPLEIDLTRLIETRLLIQANSGGGKSWCIRKILEATHGKVQHIVLDMEGEFASLREKFDYILAGKGGDIPADPRSAELLARKVLELGTSIIIDLYELKHFERIRFVKLFFDALVNAPKELWHDCIIVLDEAHVFAPEKQQSEAMGSVIDLATRGRKRGFCLIPATQRLSKMHKDVAAECNNKMIGRTGLDIDMKRAAEELGFSSKTQLHELRELEPGEFFVFGPAICKGVSKARIGEVESKHPKSGQRGKTFAPAPTNNIKQILVKLTDLPKEAEEELHDKAAMKEEIRKLKLCLKEVPRPLVDVRAIDKAVEQAINKTKVDMTRALIQSMRRFMIETEGALKDLKIEPINSTIGAWPESSKILSFKSFYNSIIPGKQYEVKKNTKVDLEFKNIGRCEKSILQFLSMRAERTFNKSQIGAMTGYSHGSGGFNNAISRLSQANLIRKQGDGYCADMGSIDAVKEILGTDFKSGDPHSLEEWLNKLGKCEKGIYKILLESPDTEFPKEDLGNIAGYSPSSGGFNNALSRLCTLGLAERSGGVIRLNPQIRGI